MSNDVMMQTLHQQLISRPLPHISAATVRSAEPAMLGRVRAIMPKLPFDDIDVLMIDEMGKDISGSGFDTKVVGRLSMPLLGADPKSPESNASSSAPMSRAETPTA